MPSNKHKARKKRQKLPLQPLQAIDTNAGDASSASQRSAVIKGLKSSGYPYWKALEGTGWQEDKDVVQAALSRGMLVNTPLWKDDEFVTSLFLDDDIKKHVAIDLWKKMTPTCRGQPPVAFKALRKSYYSFRCLPKAIKQKKVVLQGLKDEEIHWSMLPLDYQEDVDYFLVSPDPAVFEDMMSTVLDKQKVLEWVLNDADASYLDALFEWILQDAAKANHETNDEFGYWARRGFPEWLPSSQDGMMRVVQNMPEKISIADDSLLSDQSFLEQAMEINPQVAQYLPMDLTPDGHEDVFLSERCEL